MKKILTLIIVASMLMAGCDKNIDNIVDKSIVDSTEASAVVAENTPAESTVTETSETITNEKPQFEYDWQVLYYDELIKNIDNPNAMFNVYDLDGDETPELLLSDGSYHAAGGTLYTVYQEGLICLGKYGGWGEFAYDFERNYVHSYYSGQGYNYLNIYKFENDEIIDIISFYDNTGAVLEPEWCFEVNGKEVSAYIFNTEYEKYSFDIREDFIVRKHNATQSTIESVLAQYY